MSVHHSDNLPVKRSDRLHVFLAMCMGFEDNFTLHCDEDSKESFLVDAECQTVPSLQEILLHHPGLVGPALKWLADNE